MIRKFYNGVLGLIMKIQHYHLQMNDWKRLPCHYCRKVYIFNCPDPKKSICVCNKCVPAYEAEAIKSN